MFALTASSNADALGRKISNAIARQLPFATATALTSTARAVREAEVAEMRRVFDRPTPFTLNALQVVPARKDALVAEVRYKDQQPYTGKHFLGVQADGGARPMKGFERLMQAADIGAGAFEAIIPARTAAMDGYGNWSVGERQRVLSALQAQRDYAQNTTDRSRRRNPRRAEYYVGTRGGVTGVFKRQGEDDTLILVFLRRKPVYQARFDFDGVAARTFAQVYDPLFTAAMERALATAR